MQFQHKILLCRLNEVYLNLKFVCGADKIVIKVFEIYVHVTINRTRRDAIEDVHSSDIKTLNNYSVCTFYRRFFTHFEVTAENVITCNECNSS